MLKKAKALQTELTRIRRTIHQNPELGFEEFETAGLVSETLHKLDIEHQTGVGRTGVVARIGNGSGPVIGIRADMDALPIQEANDVIYKSQVAGKMHACGHDAHTTMLLGAAMLLKDEQFDGEIRLLFQPSEERQDSEGVSGATAMIDEGATEGLDAVLALHVSGQLDRGMVSIDDGFILANVDRVVGRIIGKGGHGAAPHLSRDPIFMLAPVLTALHGIVSRWIDPGQPAVVTIGKVAGGTTNNVIPSQVELDLTLRSMDDGVRQQLIAEVEQAFSVARAMGGDYEIEIYPGYPATYNDPQVADWIRQTAKGMIGEENVVARGPVMGAEDFGYMSRASKGAMMILGAKEPGGRERFLHHPEFDLDESALPIGSAILAQTALRFVRGDFL
ncbi:MAG: M20 family metallopeptidase [Ardenticatenaceae bacterium]|nr:M20 family metallopeptidase [Ardenticatenaceae bacterium]